MVKQNTSKVGQCSVESQFLPAISGSTLQAGQRSFDLSEDVRNIRFVPTRL